MTDSMASLQRKIGSAEDLQSVVRTMKAMAAASIGQYERSVLALADFDLTVKLGLGAVFRASRPSGAGVLTRARPTGAVGAIVLGSDQGLVGQFNETVADFALESLAALGERDAPPRWWAVGERVRSRLMAHDQNRGALETPRVPGPPSIEIFPVPGTVGGIAPLVSELLLRSETSHGRGEVDEVHLFYNRRSAGSLFAPTRLYLLPLEASWRSEVAGQPWPTRQLAEVIGGHETLPALIREYLFISIFRACAESLASENACRLSAMERADRNIDDLLETFRGRFHRLRQSTIDEELFDVIAGFEALEGGSL